MSRLSPHHCRWLALVLIAGFVGVTYWIPNTLYQRLPRLEDEVAQLWQARLYATGRIALPSLPAAESFGVPYILDINGQRFSKYQPGYAMFLALGVLMGEPWLINPLLFALALAVIYRLGYELFGARLALLALLLAVTSPMMLMLSASLMQHGASILTTMLYLWGIERLRRVPSTQVSLFTGLALGVTFLIRPFTALCLIAPVGLLVLKGRDLRQRCLPLGVAFALTSALLPLYNYLLVGQPMLSLFTLWWSYDQPGFGPGVGPHGYYLPDLLQNVWLGIWSLNFDLHGWLFLSLSPTILGVVLKPRRFIEAYLAAYPVTLFVAYLALFHQDRLYGPRYYVEAIAPFVYLSALGLQKTHHWLTTGRSSVIKLVLAALVPLACLILMASNLLFYTPRRFNLLQHLYEDRVGWGTLNWGVVEAAQAQKLSRAIVFTFSDNWTGAAAGILTNSLDLTGEILYARYLGPTAFEAVRAAYPERALYFWRDGQLTPATLPPPTWSPPCPTVCPPSD